MSPTGNWWDLGIPLTDNSSITSSDIADGTVTAGILASSVAAFVPGTATILVSSHSSDDQYQATIRLYDINAVAWARPQHVRVYLTGSTGQAGAAIASTAPNSFALKSTATTDVWSWVSTVNSGVAASTQTANVYLDFVTTTDGALTLHFIMNAAGASTYSLTLDWAGGCVRSSGQFGTTVAAT